MNVMTVLDKIAVHCDSLDGPEFRNCLQKRDGMEQAALLTDLNKALSHSDLEATLSCVNTE